MSEQPSIIPAEQTETPLSYGSLLEDSNLHPAIRPHIERLAATPINAEQKETDKEYETINREGLQTTFEQYVSDRARGWKDRELFKDHSASMRVHYMDDYLQTLPEGASEESIKEELEKMEADHSLLESSKEVADEVEPAMTICIPVAILKEDLKRVANLLEVIKKQNTDFEKPIEVIVWANSKFTQETEEAVSLDSQQKYEQLKELIDGNSGHAGLQIKTALQMRPESEFSMSKMRSSYMNALAVEAKNRGYGFDHPVMWLDVDTTDIKSGTLKIIFDEVKSLEPSFCRPVTYYSIDWADRMQIAESDDATKAFAIDEMARRMNLRRLAAERQKENNAAGLSPLRYKPDGYFEESGCSFMLGTYLKAGGVVESDPIDETTGLIISALSRHSAVRSALLHKRGYTPHKILHEIERWDARIYVSGRSHYEGLRFNGGLSGDRSQFFGDSETGGKYTLYTDMDELAETPAAVDLNRLYGEAKQQIVGSEEAEYLLQILNRLFDKYFEGNSVVKDDSKALSDN